jgi:hypothetical protein
MIMETTRKMLFPLDIVRLRPPSIGWRGTKEVGMDGEIGTVFSIAPLRHRRASFIHNGYPSSSSFRRAMPTATANSGPISLRTGRMKAGASVFANGSATVTGTEKNSFA